MPETGKIVAPILRRPRESGGPLDPRLRGDDRLTLKRLAFHCGLLLTSVFWLLSPAFSATHVTGAYDLGANPVVMATVNGTPEYGLVFVQRNKSVNYNNVEYGPQILNGYLNASGNLNDGAGNLWLDLIPNLTASPSDSYYVVTINIQGSVHAEIWVVPEIATIDAASVRQSQPPTSTPPSVFYQFVQQSGTDLTQRPKLNFTGSGVNCSDNSAQLRTDCTVTGGSGSAPIASATVSGTVKTDSTVSDPVVYLTTSADSLLAGKVPTGRLVSTTAPLAGGGSLASNLTLSIPAASGSQNGYLSSGDWSTFNSKENTLSFSTPLSRSVNTISCPTCEVTGNKNAASGYAGLTASTKLNAAQGQEVWALADLTNVSGTSGSGSTAILSTISAPADAQCLTWSAGSSNWVNGSCAGGSSNHNLLSATHPDTAAASPVLGDILYANSTPAWTKLAGNITTTKKFVTQTGTGAVSAAPAWNTIAAADVPSLDASKITTGTFSDGFLASAYSGVGSCTNQAVTALTRNAAPTCSTITSAMTSGTFAPNAHNLLSSSHGDSTAGTVARGDVITGQTATPKWQRLALGTTGKYLKSDGTDLVYSSSAASGTGACAANNWASTLNGDAAPTCTQPAFSNLSGTATKGQLPGATVYTDQSNTFSTGTQDMTGATATLPIKATTIAGAPGTCTANKEYLTKTDATAGQQLFICNSTGNGWNLVGDGGGAGSGASTADTFVTISHDADLTGERVLAAGSAVTVTDGGANGNATVAYNPLDNTVLMERDDFCGGAVNTNGQIGETGWAILNVGTSGVTGTGQAGTSPNLCIERLTTSGTTARGGTIALATSSQVLTLFGALGNTSNNWDSKFTFKMSATASTSVYIGFTGTLTSIPPVSFIGLRFDTSATSPGADSAFRFVVCAASTCNAHGTTYTADTSFHTVRIRSTAAGQVALTFDANGETCFNSGGTGGCTASANVPTASVDPYFMIVNQAGAAQTLDADFFGFIMTGLSR